MMLEHALLAAFAGWRIASLLVTEDGPGGIFAAVRRWSIREPKGAGIVGPPRPFFAGVLSCVWCASLWTVSGVWLIGNGLSWTPVAIIAAAGGAIVVERIARR